MSFSLFKSVLLYSVCACLCVCVCVCVSHPVGWSVCQCHEVLVQSRLVWLWWRCSICSPALSGLPHHSGRKDRTVHTIYKNTAAYSFPNTQFHCLGFTLQHTGVSLIKTALRVFEVGETQVIKRQGKVVQCAELQRKTSHKLLLSYMTLPTVHKIKAMFNCRYFNKLPPSVELDLHIAFLVCLPHRALYSSFTRTFIPHQRLTSGLLSGQCKPRYFCSHSFTHTAIRTQYLAAKAGGRNTNFPVRKWPTWPPEPQREDREREREWVVTPIGYSGFVFVCVSMWVRKRERDGGCLDRKSERKV